MHLIRLCEMQMMLSICGFLLCHEFCYCGQDVPREKHKL